MEWNRRIEDICYIFLRCFSDISSLKLSTSVGERLGTMNLQGMKFVKDIGSDDLDSKEIPHLV